jgi:hypothetical protein
MTQVLQIRLLFGGWQLRERRLKESFQVWYKDSASISLTHSSKHEPRTDLRAVCS